MSTEVEVQKQKLKNAIKYFLEKNGIIFEEGNEFIGVECILSTLEISSEMDISYWLGNKSYLIINFRDAEISVTYKKSYDKNDYSMLKISRDLLYKIAYFNNTLYFWF